MKKIIGIVVVILVVIGLIYWAKQADEAGTNNSTGPIKIGFMAPLSGTAAIYGEEARNMALLAEDDINASGGIKGRPLDLIIEDGKCDGKTAVNVWKKLVEIDKTNIILGGHCSSETLSIAPLAPAAKVLILANMISTSKIVNEGEWLFRHSPPNSYYARVTAEAVTADKINKVTLLTEEKEFSVDFTENFKNKFNDLGGVIATDERFIPDTKDFRTIITKIKNVPTDAILISTQGPETMGLLLKQMRELGLDKPTIFNAAFNAKKILEVTGGYLPTNHYAVAPYTDISRPLVQDLFKRYQEKFSVDPAFNRYFLVSTYDMVLRLKDALVQCDGNTDIECVRSYFKEQKEQQGLSGKITFNESHQPESPVALVRVINGQETYQPIGL